MAAEVNTESKRSDDHENDDQPEITSPSHSSKDVLEKASREATEDDHTVA